MKVPTRSKQLSLSFWCGFLVHTGITKACQDWYGLEGYVTLIRDNWIHLHWTVGASVALAAFVYSIWVDVRWSRDVPPPEDA